MPQPRRSRDAWRQIVAACLASGQSTADFAQQHHLNANTLSWWRSRLKGEEPAPLSLVTVSLPSWRAVEPVEVVLPSGLVLRAPESVSAQRVADLVSALGAR